jgi:hypothetical protein
VDCIARFGEPRHREQAMQSLAAFAAHCRLDACQKSDAIFAIADPSNRHAAKIDCQN